MAAGWRRRPCSLDGSRQDRLKRRVKVLVHRQHSWKDEGAIQAYRPSTADEALWDCNGRLSEPKGRQNGSEVALKSLLCWLHCYVLLYPGLARDE